MISFTEEEMRNQFFVRNTKTGLCYAGQSQYNTSIPIANKEIGSNYTKEELRREFPVGLPEGWEVNRSA